MFQPFEVERGIINSTHVFFAPIICIMYLRPKRGATRLYSLSVSFLVLPLLFVPLRRPQSSPKQLWHTFQLFNDTVMLMGFHFARVERHIEWVDTLTSFGSASARTISQSAFSLSALQPYFDFYFLCHSLSVSACPWQTFAKRLI